MRDDDEGAVPAGERLLELLHGLEVEMVGRLVEDEEVDPRGLELREVCPRPLARGERVARTADVVGAEAELREQCPGVDRDQPACGARTRRAASRPRCTRRAPGRSRRARRRGPASAYPADSSSSPRSARRSVVFPVPFAPVTATPLARDGARGRAARGGTLPARRPRRKAGRPWTGAGRWNGARAGAPTARTASPAAGSARAAVPPGAPSSGAHSCRGDPRRRTSHRARRPDLAPPCASSTTGS